MRLLLGPSRFELDVPVKNRVVENTIRVPDERYVEPDFEPLVYPASQPEIGKIGLAVEPDRLCLCVLDFGVVYDGERESVIIPSGFAECRALQRRQTVYMQEGVLIAQRETVHAAAPSRYTDHQ